MKLSFASFLAFCIIVAPASAQGQVGVNNLQRCVTSFNPNRDYFPDKVSPTESLYWDIQYHKTYKVLRNEIAGESYVLYQCGTPRPTTETGHEHFIQVPLQDGVALSSTTLIPFLEMLGLRTEIKAWLGYASSYISSPCVNQMIDDGDIAVVQDTSNTAAVNALRTRIGADIVSFHNDRSAYNSRLINITVSEFFEATNEQIFEWIKFFSVFFNLEAKANVLFDIASTRYQCVGNEAADYVDTVNQGVKPTVLWATYTNYDNVDGWNVAQCPNYYCELADLCSAKIIQSRAGTIDFYGTKLFTTADFAALAKDADHWIYPAPNWGEAYGKYKSILDQFKSVKNRRVFDTTRSGPNAWFEQRLAEFDVVLQDFCKVAGTVNSLHRLVWMRNVFTQSVDSADTVCEDVNAPLDSRATPCLLVTFPPGSLCFSGDNLVETQDGGTIPIKDLKIGDVVKTSANSYSRVYSFGHYDNNAEAKYIQVFVRDSTKPLEISADHMVFTSSSQQPVPASSLHVGDTLLMDTGSASEIVKLDEVVRRGAYAPFTESGTLVVNNMVASNYIAMTSNGHLRVGGIQLMSVQKMAHLSQAPHRLYCLMIECKQESYTPDGQSYWIYRNLKAAEWWLNQSNVIVQGASLGAALLLLLPIAAVEALVRHIGSPVLVALVTILLVARKRFTLKYSS